MLCRAALCASLLLLAGLFRKILRREAGGRPRREAAGCRGILQALPSSIPHSREVAQGAPTRQCCSAPWQAWHYYTSSKHPPAKMLPRAWLFGLITDASIFVVLSLCCSLVCPCAPGPWVAPGERWQGEQAAGSRSGSAPEVALWVCTWRAAPLRLRFLSGEGLLKAARESTGGAQDHAPHAELRKARGWCRKETGLPCTLPTASAQTCQLCSAKRAAPRSWVKSQGILGSLKPGKEWPLSQPFSEP